MNADIHRPSARHCLLCGNPDTQYVFDYTGEDIYLRKLGMTDFVLAWYRCNKCRVLFSINPPEIEQMYTNSELYDAAFDAAGLAARFERIMALAEDKSDNRQRVARVAALWRQHQSGNTKGNPGHLLDVGAGTGVFPAAFMAQHPGWSVSAVEPNGVAATFIRERLGIPVHRGLESLQQSEKYDLITFNRVLEHLSSPVDLLQQAGRLLASNGFVYIELPDVISHELDGDSNEAFASGHHMVYSPEAAGHLARQAGLASVELQRVQEPSGKWTLLMLLRPAAGIQPII